MCIIESLIREGKRRKRQQRERQEEERKKKEKNKDSEERFWWRCEKGKHPYPYRTRRLSPKRPRVLCWRRHGRVGGCQIYHGGVAQLGEHLPCKQGVKSSNLSISTRQSKKEAHPNNKEGQKKEIGLRTLKTAY